MSQLWCYEPYCQGGSCYLFDCGSLDDLKCQFTANPDFSAAVLDIDRHKFDILAEDHRQVSPIIIDRRHITEMMF